MYVAHGNWLQIKEKQYYEYWYWKLKKCKPILEITVYGQISIVLRLHVFKKQLYTN